MKPSKLEDVISTFAEQAGVFFKEICEQSETSFAEREINMAIVKLEEAVLWLEKALDVEEMECKKRFDGDGDVC